MSVSEFRREDAVTAVTRRAAPYGVVHEPPGEVVATPSRPLWALGKRAIDVTLALLVRLDSTGPVLFRQTRCGRHRRPFTVLKFRTMTDGADHSVHRDYIAALARGGDDADGLKKLTADARVTRVGTLLRRSSLDELPQLFNVLRGDMSIVGPRPAIDYELEHYAPGHWARFDVRPGLTGLWQVSGRSRLGFTEMLALDAEYARRSSLLLDASILVRTPLEILRGRAS